MAERGKVAVLLVVASGVLTGVGSTLDMYTEVQTVTGKTFTDITSLRGSRSTVREVPPADVVLDQGLPMIVAVALMVVAAVLTLRGGRTASVARPSLLVLAGLFAGLLLAFTIGVFRRGELARSSADPSGWTYDLDFLPGFHLLVAAVVVGLAGAVLAQRAHPAATEPQEEEAAVVVHRLADDDTPPLGIPIGHQEAR